MASERIDRKSLRRLRCIEKDNVSIVHAPSSVGPLSLTFGDAIRKQAKERPDALFIQSHHQQKSLTYSQANDRSDDLARGLAAQGVKKGDRVAIMAGNEIEYIEVFLACTKLGTPCALINYAYSEQELHSVLASINVSVLIMVPAFDRYDYRQWIPRFKERIRCLQHIVLLHGSRSDMDHGHAMDYEWLVSSGARHEMDYDLDLERVAQTLSDLEVINLQFTSGSTGLPKASALTHRGLLHCAKNIGDTMYLTPSDRICLPVPLFHSFGIVIGVTTALVHGASVVLCDNKFNVKATLESIGRYKCTGLYGVTTMFIAEMNYPDFAAYDLSTLRFAILSGSAVPEALVRKVWASIGITQTHTNWGMTEAGSIVTMTRDTDTLHQRMYTSGRLFPGFSAKIVDPATNLVVPRGERGEIVLRGPGIQTNYFSNPSKTAEAHVKSPEDGLEWFHTGDQGIIDDQGFFTITGRIKDMIIRGGENISPVEIEARLAAHPAVAQSSVIGVPDEKYGEQICAFLEPRAESVLPSDDEVRAWVRQTLAHFKAPRYLVWLGTHSKFRAWPKTGTGKLRKPDLRRIAQSILSEASAPPDDRGTLSSRL
ncbi:hypothetical protein H2204_008507 [Knufia peltigerae]|uniref:Uncharacterized protein n=1 Tax=Knufia peltigerae TaxID=1002370 RepID=A0AA39CWU2_9EURO|nr:hypothetical protein H2204_008507 [Knufia peltigerae]